MTFLKRILHSEKSAGHILAFCLFVTLAATYSLPLIQDEAYYLAWAKRSTWPDLGFFDHPPFVSWQAAIIRLTDDFRSARLGVWIFAVATAYIQTMTAQAAYGNRVDRLLPAILSLATIGGLANAVLITPDSGLMFFWSLTIYFAVKAVSQNPKFWLLAGIAAGLGFYTKYTILILAPVLFFGTVWQNPKQLSTKWPYLGLILTIAVMLPQLRWNAKHDWVTLRFQLGHGFSSKADIVTDSLLPKAEGFRLDSEMATLYKNLNLAMSNSSGFEETLPKHFKSRSRLEQAWMNLGDFLGGAAALWGGFIVYLFILGLKKVRYRETEKQTAKAVLCKWIHASSPQGMLWSGVFVPLAFFLVVSPFSKIEANWSAIHMPASAVLLSWYWTPLFQEKTLLKLLAFGHCVLFFALSHLGFLTSNLPNLQQNRFVQEMGGLDNLTDLMKDYSPTGVIAVDSYQLKSAILARSNSLVVVQWPGITRPSEFTRGHPDDLKAERQILKQSRFSLLTSEALPPEIPGFHPFSLTGVRACSNGTVGVYTVEKPILPCEHGVRDWWLIELRR